jgi:hypothetical protein
MDHLKQAERIALQATIKPFTVQASRRLQITTLSLGAYTVGGV